MALIGTTDNPFSSGKTINNAYAKVVQVNINYTSKTGKIDIAIYNSIEDRENLSRHIKDVEYVIDTDIYNQYFTEQILGEETKTLVCEVYNYIKAKPEWELWMDI